MIKCRACIATANETMEDLKSCCGHKPQVVNIPKYKAKCWYCKNETNEHFSHIEMINEWNELTEKGSVERRFSEKIVKVE